MHISQDIPLQLPKILYPWTNNFYLQLQFLISNYSVTIITLLNKLLAKSANANSVEMLTDISGCIETGGLYGAVIIIPSVELARGARSIP